MHAERFKVVSVNAPFPLPTFRLNAIAPKVAMMDARVAWLFGLLAKPEKIAPRRRKRAR